jgi:hypothetical protein
MIRLSHTRHMFSSIIWAWFVFFLVGCNQKDLSFKELQTRAEAGNPDAQWLPQSLTMCLLTHLNGGRVSDTDSVGVTPTDAVETTALPKKSLRIGVALGKALSV